MSGAKIFAIRGSALAGAAAALVATLAAALADGAFVGGVGEQAASATRAKRAGERPRIQQSYAPSQSLKSTPAPPPPTTRSSRRRSGPRQDSGRPGDAG